MCVELSVLSSAKSLERLYVYPGDCATFSAVPRFLRMSKIPRMVKHITVSPPMTPPTMGPIFVDFCSEGAGVELDIDDGRILPFDTRRVELCVAVVAGGGFEVAKEALLSVLEADVVVAFTVFGTAKRLSTAAVSPQAMYSNDWSGPLIKSAVEQNCLESLSS